ncbi:MAG: polysaccharide deacetylase family protein [Deltaproteobacteria bacterium]|nr:polysaccharide deacetylase family protein [Deltaproteobacteria bacterium]
MATEISALRWALKKTARKALALSTAGCEHAWRWAGKPVTAPVRVLTYHRFGAARRDPFCVRVEDFEQHMAWIAGHCDARSLADVTSIVGGQVQFTRPGVLVTIDDGLRSLYTEALPILQRYRVPAVAFVPAGEIGTASDEARLSWNELRDLHQAGITIGSHGWVHRSLGRLSAAAVRDDMERSRSAIEQRLGIRVSAFAYPFGTRADYNAVTEAVLRDSGYTCAFTSQHGAVRAGMNPFSLPRIKVEGGEDLWMFRLLCRGALDGWQWVDHTLWRLQASERP